MSRLLSTLVLAVLIPLTAIVPVAAAEATTGSIVGTVSDTSGKPVSGARVAVASPSGRAGATTDARGRFTILGLVADTYTVSVQATGFRSVSQSGVNVLPGGSEQTSFRLETELRTIGRVSAASGAYPLGATGDAFTVSGAQARALSPPVASSGLANYSAGSVQGAIASVPGVDFDPFANAVLRGGKVDDAVFNFDSVPIPQGLIAEPGGNVAGAQLPTTGIGSTTVTLAGYQTQGDNALGGVVDQIPLAARIRADRRSSSPTARARNISLRTCRFSAPRRIWDGAMRSPALSRTSPFATATVSRSIRPKRRRMVWRLRGADSTPSRGTCTRAPDRKTIFRSSDSSAKRITISTDRRTQG